MVLSFEERTPVDTIILLYVNSFPTELVVLPVALVFIPVLVDHFSFATLYPAFPFASISSMAGFLNTFSVSVALKEVAIVHWLSDEWIFTFAWIFLAFHYHFYSFAALEVVLELSDVDYVFGVTQFSATVVLAS